MRMIAGTDPARAAVVRLHPSDNTVVAVRALEPGADIAGEQVQPVQAVPAGHKMATCNIAAGQPVIKYGQFIGSASRDIAAGQHVHAHNVAVSAARARDSGEASSLQGPATEPARSFMGYRRADGRVGVRNYVGVLTSVNCSATVARMIAVAAERSGLLEAFPGVDGVVPVTHSSGCGMAGSGEGYATLRRTLEGVAANPNFAAILLVGLGCEVMQVRALAQRMGNANGGERLRVFTIQEAGGTRAAVEQGLAELRELMPLANAARRTEVGAGELVLGLQCGGSDAWSGITSNPALGNAADRLVALGGTVLLSETPEIFGAEHLLYARAASADVKDRLKARLDWWSDYTSRHGVQMNDNPSPGNLRGGLATILEKSLGAVAKAGTSPLQDVVLYGAPVTTRGLVFMDSPGFDPCSVTGQVASGATLIAFTTGRGSAFGCQPSPSIKLSSNSDVYRRMRDDIDVNCGTIIDDAVSIEDKGAEILTCLLDVASGGRSKSEQLGYGSAEFVPWLIGATM